MLHFLSPVHPCNDVWVLRIHFTSHITFIGDLDFVAFVTQTIKSASLKVLPLRIFFLNFNLRLLSLC
jgi:hypothetical protein